MSEIIAENIQLKQDEILNVDEIRKDFPILKEKFSDAKGNEYPLIYLDNAATTQKPQQVLNALNHYYQHENANVHRAIHKLGERATDAYEGSRKAVAKFINARSTREVVFTRGTTEAINLVATSWGKKFIGSGDEILLSEMEHHSNLIPWQILAKETGAVLRFIPFSKSNGKLTLSFITNSLHIYLLHPLVSISKSRCCFLRGFSSEK